MTRASGSRARVEYDGGTPVEQQAAQDALDAHFRTGIVEGGYHIKLRRDGSLWRVWAEAQGSAIGTGETLPSIPEPWDATSRVVAVLTDAGISASA